MHQHWDWTLFLYSIHKILYSSVAAAAAAAAAAAVENLTHAFPIDDITPVPSALLCSVCRGRIIYNHEKPYGYVCVPPGERTCAAAASAATTTTL